MIVMKFGGSSLESPEAILRVCRIVKTHRPQHPVVVVSAFGKTTNQLLEMASDASRGKGYSARSHLNAIKDTHYRISDELLLGRRHEAVTELLQTSFRELHSLVHDLCEDGRKLTAQLSDSISSFGERLSSQIVAAALAEYRIPSIHLDSRDFIVTGNRHGSASPLYWETYARLRRAIPPMADSHVVVMGGFIGATEDGVTTTLGRGGSDLTASLVGAGIGAEEIQIWTDVDGMLTRDPRVAQGGLRVHSISYLEAAAMAAAGAKVLHPETVTPAVRQRIPFVIRNSRHPEREGTRIVAECTPCSNPVKTIAVKQNLLALEITSPDVATGPELIRILHDFCHRKMIEPALICQSGDAVMLALTGSDIGSDMEAEFAGCLQIRLRKDVALIALVGAGVTRSSNVCPRALAALRGVGATVVSAEDLSLRLLVPQAELRRAVIQLHNEFFREFDRREFSPVAPERRPVTPEPDPLVAFAIRRNALIANRITSA